MYFFVVLFKLGMMDMMVDDVILRGLNIFCLINFFYVLFFSFLEIIIVRL